MARCFFLDIFPAFWSSSSLSSQPIGAQIISAKMMSRSSAELSWWLLLCFFQQGCFWLWALLGFVLIVIWLLLANGGITRIIKKETTKIQESSNQQYIQEQISTSLRSPSSQVRRIWTSPWWQQRSHLPAGHCRRGLRGQPQCVTKLQDFGMMIGRIYRLQFDSSKQSKLQA